MRIHRLTLRNYRGITARTVEFAARGVTVVEGDNELGKSSMAEAIDILLEYRDDSSAKPVRAIQPVGQDVGTEIEAEMETGPYRFVYRKRFHKDRGTTLDVTAPAPEHLRGRDAHDRVRAILDETLDHALWKALRVQQGDALRQADLDGQRSLGAALDEAAQGELGSEREAGLVDRAEAEYLQYFTATGRRNAQLEARRKAADAAAIALDDARTRLAALEEDVARYAQLGAEIAAAEADLVALERAATAHEAAHARVADAERDLRGLELEAQAAESERAAVEAVAHDRRRRIATIAEISRQVEALEAAEASHAEERAALAAAARSATESYERARAGFRAATELARIRREDLAHLQDVTRADELAENVASLDAARDIEAAARAELEANPVDHDALERIERARAAVDATKSAMVATCPMVRVEASEAGTITEGPRTVAVPRGGSHERHVTTELAVELVGGVVRVSVGGEAAALAQRLADAERELARALAAAGVADYAEARVAFRERSRAEQDLHVAGRASAGTSATRIEDELSELTARADAYLAARPPFPPIAPTLEHARALATEAEADELAAHAALDRAEHDASSARVAFEELDKVSLKATTLIERARAELAVEEAELAGSRADAPDDDLEARLFARSVRATEARKAFEEAREALEELRPDAIRTALDDARRAVREARALLEDLRTRRTALGARVEALGEQGLHHQVSEAEAAAEHTRAEHESWEHRAAAARRLFETLGRHRDLARQAYLAPLRTRIESLGRVLFGPTFAVELDDDLRITRRSLNGLTLDFDLLSAGAREQLAVIARLACATLVASDDGGVPVILDDVLGFSDPSRLARLGEVFAAAADCQLIVLTCVPDRYASVGPAQVIRLTH